MLAGDSGALDGFVAERYLPRPLSLRPRPPRDGDRELTREIVQTTMCKALAKLDTYRGEASLLTWLCACCRNEVLMYPRRSRSTAPVAVELEEGLEPAAAASRVVAARDPEVAVPAARDGDAGGAHGARRAAQGHYARALEWKYVERLPVREIAARLKLGGRRPPSRCSRGRARRSEGRTGIWPMKGTAGGPPSGGRGKGSWTMEERDRERTEGDGRRRWSDEATGPRRRGRRSSRRRCRGRRALASRPLGWRARQPRSPVRTALAPPADAAAGGGGPWPVSPPRSPLPSVSRQRRLVVARRRRRRGAGGGRPVERSRAR